MLLTNVRIFHLPFWNHEQPPVTSSINCQRSQLSIATKKEPNMKEPNMQLARWVIYYQHRPHYTGCYWSLIA